MYPGEIEKSGRQQCVMCKSAREKVLAIRRALSFRGGRLYSTNDVNIYTLHAFYTGIPIGVFTETYILCSGL